MSNTGGSEEVDETTPLTAQLKKTTEEIFSTIHCLPGGNSNFQVVPQKTPNSQLAELPQHILISIFEFLVETYSPKKHKIVHHSLEGTNRSQRRRHVVNSSQADSEVTFEEFSKAQTKFNLVCKSFYEASSSDVLWQGTSGNLYRFLVLRSIDNGNEIFRDPKRHDFKPREIIKSKVKLTGAVRTKVSLPSSEYKQFYIQLKKMQHRQFTEFQAIEKHQVKVSKKLHWLDKSSSFLFLALSSLIPICTVLFLVGLTVHQAIEKYSSIKISRYYYWITYSPILFLLASLIGYPVLATLLQFYQKYTSITSMRLTKNRGCGCDLLSIWMLSLIGIGAFAYMSLGTLLNVAAFPYLSTFFGIADPFNSSWDRRAHMVPWLVIFIPIFLIGTILTLLLLYLFIDENLKVFRNKTTTLKKKLQDAEWYSLLFIFCTLSIECFFLLLGIKLEMPKVTSFSIAYCFIPLHPVGIFVIGMAILITKDEIRNSDQFKKFGKWDVVGLCMVNLFGVSLEAAFILTSCQETIIGPFVWLSWVMPVITLCGWAFAMVIDEAN